MVDRRSIQAHLPGPSFVSSCILEHDETVLLRLPAPTAVATGPARVLVSFDGYQERFVLTGEVARTANRFGATTVDLEVDGKNSELLALLEFAASDPRAPRRSPRFPLGELVELEAGGPARSAIIKDISASGCFLQIPGPRLPAVGEEVLLRPRGGNEVRGEVVRSFTASPRGVGVRFVARNDPATLQVRRWLSYANA